MLYKQKDLILIKVRYSDDTNYKKRPAIIVSSDIHNKKEDDVIIVPLISNLHPEHYSFIITNNEIQQGDLKFDSKVRTHKITVIDKRRIIKTIGEVNSNVLERIRFELLNILF